MASNKKTEARKAGRVAKQARWVTKFRSDVGKVFDTVDVRPGYIPSGQPFTTGKSKKE